MSIHEKSWGHEEWIVNNEWYCGKRLHFTVVDGQTSMHFHKNKHETMFVEQGVFEITTIATKDKGAHRTIHLQKGDSIEIDRLVPHRIRAMIVPSILIEFSTHHEDSDSYRIAP